MELVWNGKTREVCTTVLPFQSLEHIDEPRREAPAPEQFGLFDTRGRQVKGWTNKLIWGDNKLILSSLKSGALRRQIEEAGGLKLIYIDPPFDVGADFSMDIEIGGESYHKEANLLEQIAYRDTWGRGADSFIAMIYERLILMRDLLAEDGSIYVHCDWRVNAFMRLTMNEIFGSDRFENEVVWERSLPHGNIDYKFGASHDTILRFSRADGCVWNPQYSAHREEYLRDFYKYVEADGRRYRLISCINPNPDRPNLNYEWRGVKRVWKYSQERMKRMHEEGLLVYSKNGVPSYKGYLDQMKGVPLQDMWTDIPPLMGSSREWIDYPTQKPEALLERILQASSNPGDLVADFFCGSGTTAAVAEKLGRRWIATDLGKFAIHTTRKRLIGVQRQARAEGRPFRAFEVLNLGKYERQAYLGLECGSSLPLSKRRQAVALQKEREFRELILRAYQAEPLADQSFFHGKKAGRLVVTGPINLPVGRLFVEEVITECRKRGASRADILAFEFEMGLFPAALDEAKAKGIDLQPKYIPAEVFDKRAVDKGQVVFHDISFVEATPRYDKQDKLTLGIELTDFSVYYTQHGLEEAADVLKEGKSQVLCHEGQLWKVAKSKTGVVTRERLTKHWTDWIDYWAVDFDYMSRQEIIQVAPETGVECGGSPPLSEREQAPALQTDFEERWTGGYVFENEWQSFRTRQCRELELTSAPHLYPRAGRYTVAVKVIDIFGNDTMILVPVSVG